MKYKIAIFHKLLVVYRTISSLRGGCTYRRVDVMAVRVWYLMASTELLWNCVVWCDVSAREYRGFESLALCSSINKYCCCSVYIFKDSQQFISFPFRHGCNSCKVYSGLPYSCWLLIMCIAYVDTGLLDFYVSYVFAMSYC